MILEMPRSDSVWVARALERGRDTPSAPTPMIALCPDINRGTEWLVPMPPGLVSEIVVPA